MKRLPWGRALLALALGGGGCDSSEGSQEVGPAWATPGAPAPTATPEASTAETAQTRALRDADFVESELNRDPFRNYVIELKTKAPMAAQRTVLMPTTPLTSMRLIAIITGIDQPRAMIVDERGVGHVTSRGDFVGVADVVQTGGAENLPVALNWRVDRIRANEVVLAREDPSGPNRPPLTQVIPLYPAGEAGDRMANGRPNEG
jgi:type IV pilus assembly protein PilP